MPREPLPATRPGFTHNFCVYDEKGGETEVYVRTGHYADGRLGEVFLSVGKEGSTMRGLLDIIGRELSMLLQDGNNVARLVDKFGGYTFFPDGRTDNPEIPTCTSIIDYTVNWLGQLQDRLDFGELQVLHLEEAKEGYQI